MKLNLEFYAVSAKIYLVANSYKKGKGNIVRDVVDKATRARVEAMSFLRPRVNDGERLFTITDYVGNQGTAYVKVFQITGDDFSNLTWYIGNGTGMKMRERNGSYWLKTSGGNYSRAQHVVDELSLSLFGEFGRLKYSEL